MGGNCCGSETRSMVNGAGENWGSLVSTKKEKAEKTCNMKRQIRVFGGHQNGAFGQSPPSTSINSTAATVTVTRELVKIKISKKELEELLGRVDLVQGLSAKLVHARLIRAADRRFNDDVLPAEHQGRRWSPALQSIPEVN